MNYTTIWHREADGLTHRAVVIGNATDGFEIRSDCGLIGNACWEKQLDEDADVTCHRCSSVARLTQAAPHADTAHEHGNTCIGNGRLKPSSG